MVFSEVLETDNSNYVHTIEIPSEFWGGKNHHTEGL